MSARITLDGMTFGKWSVIRHLSNGVWSCRCECGTVRGIPSWGLRTGRTTSCGCARPELVREIRTSHGMSQSAEYGCWNNMRLRCTNPNDKVFKHYGGRGISVCERWESFENFIADMGKRPSAAHSIEREDVNGNYTPDNCVWATQREQARNRRNTVYIEHEGVSRKLIEVAEETGEKYGTLLARESRKVMSCAS